MPCRILIADDHSILRKTLKATLEAHPGWEVCGEAVNGAEAVEKAAELKPDVLILDFSMPVMGGFEAARRILSVSPDLTILLFTNHSHSGLEGEAQNIGIRQVITKESDGLVSAIENELNEKMRSALDSLQANAKLEKIKPATRTGSD